MRALVIADREPRPSIRALLDAGGIDLVLTLGDLQPSWIEGLEGLDGVPKLGVYGNHDDEPYLDRLGIRDLHGIRAEVGGLRFAGFEGCVRYRPGPHQYTQAEATAMAAVLPAADVLVCHNPPAGVNDDPDDRAHHGYEGLRGWVERVRPRWLLHGHTYPPPGRVVRRLGATHVVHVAGARVLELGGRPSGAP